MENRKLKGNGLFFYIGLGLVSFIGFMFLVTFKSWLALAGNIAYVYLLIPLFFITIITLIRKSAIIILKDGFIIQESEKEVLELKKVIKVYEKEELKSSTTITEKVSYFYLCFEKENGEVFKLNVISYSKKDREYLYKYVEYYGLNIEKIDSPMLNIF